MSFPNSLGINSVAGKPNSYIPLVDFTTPQANLTSAASTEKSTSSKVTLTPQALAQQEARMRKILKYVWITVGILALISVLCSIWVVLSVIPMLKSLKTGYQTAKELPGNIKNFTATNFGENGPLSKQNLVANLNQFVPDSLKNVDRKNLKASVFGTNGPMSKENLVAGFQQIMPNSLTGGDRSLLKLAWDVYRLLK